MRTRTLILAAALVLAGTGSGWAQETTGSITGRVVDAQGLGVPGVAVTVTGPQGARSFTSDADGRFNAPFLTPGTYTVRTELQGFKSTERSDLMVRLGQEVDLTIEMEVGGVQEVIEVTGSSPVVDTASTTAGAVIGSDLMERVPVGRRVSDTLYIAPGVSTSGAGMANPSIAGGSGLENQYVIDGVNITNTGYGALGSYSIYHGSLGQGVNFDFVKEVQVKTAGYEAEYGQATGGVVNVVTKSGSNSFRGSMFGFWRPGDLEGDWKTHQTENGTITTTATQFQDVGVEVSGPVLQNRLFFFGAFNPQWESRSIIAPAGFPLEELGEVDRKRQINTYSAKATYQLASSHRLDGSFFGDPATGEMGPQRVSSLRRTDTAGFSELEYGGHNQIAKYDGVIGSNWLLEASFARAYNNLAETPSVDEYNVLDDTGPTSIFSGGIGFFEEGNTGTNLQYQAKSTHLLGDHSIRYGVTYEDIQYDNTIQRTGPTFTLHNGEQTATGASITILPDPVHGRIYRVTRANTSRVRNTTQQYTSFFVQDTWRVADRLTIRPGLRYEQQKLVGNLEDFQWDGNWGPRIGVTYDVLGNGRSKLFANWGRFYAKIPNDLAARALSADAGVTRADYFDAQLTQPIQDGVIAAGTDDHFQLAGQFASDFDPDSKSTYLDETLVGFELEAFTNTNVGIRWTRRRFGRVLEDIGTVPIASYFVSDEAGSVEYFITNPDEESPVLQLVPGFTVAFESPIHDYDAVELTVDRRFSDNWGVLTSYRWSRLHGTFEGFFRNDNGQSDPGITSLYDFPTNDPSYSALAPELGFLGDIRYQGSLGAGPLPTDRPHQLKVYGNYTFDWGVNLGVGVQASSGKPLTAMAANPVYDNAGEIPMAPRGSGIETVDGFRERAPFTTDVSLQASYNLSLGDTRRVVLIVNAFNVFNQRDPLDYDADFELGFGVPNSDFGAPVILGIPQFQTPRQIQFGARFEF